MMLKMIEGEIQYFSGEGLDIIIELVVNFLKVFPLIGDLVNLPLAFAQLECQMAHLPCPYASHHMAIAYSPAGGWFQFS